MAEISIWAKPSSSTQIDPPTHGDTAREEPIAIAEGATTRTVPIESVEAPFTELFISFRRRHVERKKQVISAVVNGAMCSLTGT